MMLACVKYSKMAPYFLVLKKKVQTGIYPLVFLYVRLSYWVGVIPDSTNQPTTSLLICLLTAYKTQNIPTHSPFFFFSCQYQINHIGNTVKAIFRLAKITSTTMVFLKTNVCTLCFWIFRFLFMFLSLYAILPGIFRATNFWKAYTMSGCGYEGQVCVCVCVVVIFIE